MKVLVLLSIAALSLGSPISLGKGVIVAEDGSVRLIGSSGEIDISRSVVDPRKVEIIIKNALGFVRKIEVDEMENIRNVDLNVLDARFLNVPRAQITQSDILASIFRQHQGPVDEPSYRILMAKIEDLVRSRVLHQRIFQALRNIALSEQLNAESLNSIVQGNGINDLIQNSEVRRLIQADELRNVLQGNGINNIIQRVGLNNNEGINGMNFEQFSQVIPSQALSRMINQHGISGVQGLLWNIGHLTPAQRFQVLIQQQPQNQQGLEQEMLSGQVQISPLEQLNQLNQIVSGQQLNQWNPIEGGEVQISPLEQPNQLNQVVGGQVQMSPLEQLKQLNQIVGGQVQISPFEQPNQFNQVGGGQVQMSPLEQLKQLNQIVGGQVQISPFEQPNQFNQVGGGQVQMSPLEQLKLLNQIGGQQRLNQWNPIVGGQQQQLNLFNSILRGQQVSIPQQVQRGILNQVGVNPWGRILGQRFVPQQWSIPQIQKGVFNQQVLPQPIQQGQIVSPQLDLLQQEQGRVLLA